MVNNKWVICILLLLLSSAFLCKSNTQEDKELPSETTRVPDQEYWDFSVTLTSKGIPYAKVNAGHSTRYFSENNVYLDENVKVDFFDDNGIHTSHLTADKALINESSHDMVAQNNVVVVSDSGVTLETEELMWAEKENKIHTDKYVKVITSRDTLYGYGFLSDRSLKNWQIKKPTGVSHRKINIDK